MSTESELHRQALDVLESTFRALATEPRPLALDCTGLAPGLPQRLIPLNELRDLLLDRALPQQASDAVWAKLLTRARGGDPEWMVAAAGMALPGLRAAANQLAHACRATTLPDLDAEVLTGFIEAVKTVPLTWKWLAYTLRLRAYQAGARFVERELNDPAHSGVELDLLTESATPPPPWGHPDFVLNRAVRAGVITEFEAELIGRTRLEQTQVKQLAAQWQMGYSTLRRHRKNAENRLVAWLKSPTS